MSPVAILDEADLPDDFEGAEPAESPEDQAEDSFLLSQNDVYLEELLLRLPTSEFEDQTETSEDELPENVSLDYYVIEFDYITPLKGSMTSTFGYRNHPLTGKRSFHYGVDIGGAKGEIISAFSSGTVELTGYNSIYGNYLFIRHKDGIITFYGHCSKILVDEGQLVRMGDAVAKVGSTGLSTGPHLHFEVRNGDVILDPLRYVSPEG
jgi:murein DD-endopeptidase MepM/ murein hydrolase activator NlpD